MSPRSWSLLALLLAVSSTFLGCPSCPYESQCDGTTLRTCSVGVDQMVGSPSWGSSVCAAPNGFCVTIDDRQAQCAMDESPTCGSSFEPLCEDDAVVSCVNGYRVAADCARNGAVCVVGPDGPTCASDPVTACVDDEYAPHCEGTSVMSCSGGLVRVRDCAAQDPAGVCTETETDYGPTAWCDLP